MQFKKVILCTASATKCFLKETAHLTGKEKNGNELLKVHDDNQEHDVQ